MKKLYLGVAIVGVLFVGFALWKNYQEKNRTLDPSSAAVLQGAEELSNLVPNYIYLGKNTASTNMVLLKEVVQTRLELKKQIEVSLQDLSPEILPLTQKLIDLNQELGKHLLTSSAKQAKDHEHIKALGQQWDMRLKIYRAAVMNLK